MIEQQTINGRKAAVAYLDGTLQPTDKDNYSYARILFDDDGGNSSFLIRRKFAPLSTEALTRRIAQWGQAIAILDESELPLRDMIERDLANIAGVPGTKYGDATKAVDALMKKITRLRVNAIKKAFRLLRDSAP